jgi:hypothetical protein
MTTGDRQFQEQLLHELLRIAAALEVIAKGVYPGEGDRAGHVRVRVDEARRRG